MNRKRSKLQRKYLNAMRGMGDVPWPARRFKYPPTFGNRRTFAAMTPRRANRMRRMWQRAVDATVALERAQQAAASRAEANAKRRGLFKRGGDKRGSFVGRMLRRRKV